MLSFQIERNCMPYEHSSDVKFEIGHVLFIDIVGYSKLLINEQSEQIQTLRGIVRGTEQFRLAEAEGKLLRLPTGDGGALVFRTNPEAPVLCALEISKALKDHPELWVRMGIHSGPVNEVTDLNEQANIAGAGINIAQRVMDCGDAGHILLSRHVADDLETYPRWQPCLHDLGEFEVKHGARIGIVNLYHDQIGNPQLPKKFQAMKKHSARMRWAVTTAALLALTVIVAGIAMFSRYRVRSTLPAPEKSIAVLPFENLSANQENAFFTDGVQGEIFAIQSDVAVQIATQLQAKLSPKAKSAIEERPTKDLAAYDLYVRGKLLITIVDPKKLREAARLLDQATARDPQFFLAYCGLAKTHGLLYSIYDHTQAQRDLADASVKAAIRLRPEAGEAHLARAEYLYRCYLDYDNARAELALAERSLPNNAQV